jgi:hypothetical protein
VQRLGINAEAQTGHHRLREQQNAGLANPPKLLSGVTGAAR